MIHGTMAVCVLVKCTITIEWMEDEKNERKKETTHIDCTHNTSSSVTTVVKPRVWPDSKVKLKRKLLENKQ